MRAIPKDETNIPLKRDRYIDEIRRRRSGDLYDDATLRPVDDRVLVLVDEPEKVVSGLIIPDIATEYFNNPLGRVLAIGPKQKEVRVGQHVMFRKWGGVEITKAGDTLMILPASDVLGVVED